jgi:hypothetical protein
MAPVDNGSGLIVPGCSVTMPLLMGVPEEPGTHMVLIRVDKESSPGNSGRQSIPACGIKLTVKKDSNPLNSVLTELARQCRLPADYEHKSCGPLGRLKTWLTEKLVGGFRRRYVDVLSRQQTAVNSSILMAITELNAKVDALQRATAIDNCASRTSADFLERTRKLDRRVAESKKACTDKNVCASSEGQG